MFSFLESIELPTTQEVGSRETTLRTLNMGPKTPYFPLSCNFLARAGSFCASESGLFSRSWVIDALQNFHDQVLKSKDVAWWIETNSLPSIGAAHGLTATVPKLLRSDKGRNEER